MPITLNGSTGEVFPSWTTAGRPASPVAAQTGYNTTLTTLEVYNGSLWEPVVTTNDTGTVTPTMLSQKLTQMTVQNSTAGTSIPFTSIPSWAKRITIMFNGVSTSGTSVPIVQLGSASYTTTGYSGGVTGFSGGTLANSTNSSGFGLTNSTTAAASNVMSGHVVLTNVSGNIWVSSSNVSMAAAINAVGGGTVTLAGVLDRLQITTVNGTDTFDAGSINVMYEG